MKIPSVKCKFALGNIFLHWEFRFSTGNDWKSELM